MVNAWLCLQHASGGSELGKAARCSDGCPVERQSKQRTGGQGGAVEGTERVKQARGDLCLMALPFNGERSGSEGGSEKQGRGTLWVTLRVFQRGRQ